VTRNKRTSGPNIQGRP